MAPKPDQTQDRRKSHRAALDGHTECGIDVEKDGLLYRAADDPEPPTCGRCLKLLTIFCGPCGSDTVRNRRRETTNVYSSRYPDGEPIEVLRCACGFAGTFSMQPVGAKAQQRRLKRQRAEAKTLRETRERERREQRAEAMDQELAEHAHPDTCALCEEPLPGPLSEMYGLAYYRGWKASAMPFLPWFYCLEHRALGQELDETMAATFKHDALAIRAQVAARVTPV